MNKELLKKHRFNKTFMSVDDVMKLPDPKWLVDNVLQREVVAQIYGESGSYKSFIALDMALCIASGTPWLGETEVEQAKVVYIAGEGVVGYKKRIKAWLIDRDLGVKDIQDNFKFLAESLPLNDAHDCSVFLELVKDFVGDDSIGLIVFDTQARCTEGVDENSNKEMGLIIQRLDRFKKELNTTVMLIHHTGLKNPWARGASAVRAAIDAQFAVSRKEHQSFVVFQCTKQKDWEDGWKKHILLVPCGESMVISVGDSHKIDTVTLSYQNLSPKRRKLLHILQHHYFNTDSEGLTYSDWHEKATDIMSKAGFNKALTLFKETKLVTTREDRYLPVPGIPLKG